MFEEYAYDKIYPRETLKFEIQFLFLFLFFLVFFLLFFLTFSSSVSFSPSSSRVIRYERSVELDLALGISDHEKARTDHKRTHILAMNQGNFIRFVPRNFQPPIDSPPPPLFFCSFFPLSVLSRSFYMPHIFKKKLGAKAPSQFLYLDCDLVLSLSFSFSLSRPSSLSLKRPPPPPASFSPTFQLVLEDPRKLANEISRFPFSLALVSPFYSHFPLLYSLLSSLTNIRSQMGLNSSLCLGAAKRPSSKPTVGEMVGRYEDRESSFLSFLF